MPDFLIKAPGYNSEIFPAALQNYQPADHGLDKIFQILTPVSDLVLSPPLLTSRKQCLNLSNHIFKNDRIDSQFNLSQTVLLIEFIIPWT